MNPNFIALASKIVSDFRLDSFPLLSKNAQSICAVQKLQCHSTYVMFVILPSTKTTKILPTYIVAATSSPATTKFQKEIGSYKAWQSDFGFYF